MWVSGGPRALPFGAARRAGADELPPHFAIDLGVVGHDDRRFESARADSVCLTVDFQTSKSLKPW